MFEKLLSALAFARRWWNDDKPQIWIAEGAPTVNGGGTDYNLLRFGGRGTTKVRPWGLENFLLTTPEQQEADRKFLAGMGFELVLDPWPSRAR